MRRTKIVAALVVVLVLSFALTAWAAIYRYGDAVTTLVYNPTNYQCPTIDGDVWLWYWGDGFGTFDSTGSVRFDITETLDGDHRYMMSGLREFDNGYGYKWDTNIRAVTFVSADPAGLSLVGDMTLAIYCSS